jgi:hypothetical protein
MASLNVKSASLVGGRGWYEDLSTDVLASVDDISHLSGELDPRYNKTALEVDARPIIVGTGLAPTFGPTYAVPFGPTYVMPPLEQSPMLRQLHSPIIWLRSVRHLGDICRKSMKFAIL